MKSLLRHIGDAGQDVRKPGARVEAFNSKLRGECLNAHWFMSLDDARAKLEAWRRFYNEDRPHSGIGQKTPILLHIAGVRREII